MFKLAQEQKGFQKAMEDAKRQNRLLNPNPRANGGQTFSNHATTKKQFDHGLDVGQYLDCMKWKGEQKKQKYTPVGVGGTNKAPQSTRLKTFGVPGATAVPKKKEEKKPSRGAPFVNRSIKPKSSGFGLSKFI